jgi:hypothetical protein
MTAVRLSEDGSMGTIRFSVCEAFSVSPTIG